MLFGKTNSSVAIPSLKLVLEILSNECGHRNVARSQVATARLSSCPLSSDRNIRIWKVRLVDCKITLSQKTSGSEHSQASGSIRISGSTDDTLAFPAIVLVDQSRTLQMQNTIPIFPPSKDHKDRHFGSAHLDSPTLISLNG